MNDNRYYGNYAEGMTTHGTKDSYLPPHHHEDDPEIRRMHRSRAMRHDASGPWEMFAEFSGTLNNRRSSGDWEDHSYYRGQPRTASGRFRRMMRYSHEFEEGKKRVAAEMSEMCEPQELLEKAIKEAGEFITYAASGKAFEAMKEFAELAILVCAVAEHLPEDVTEAAEMEALEYYERKIDHSRYSGSHHYRGDDRNPLSDYGRRNTYYRR